MFFFKFNIVPSVGKKTMCALALFVLCGWLFFQLAYNVLAKLRFNAV